MPSSCSSNKGTVLTVYITNVSLPSSASSSASASSPTTAVGLTKPTSDSLTPSNLPEFVKEFITPKLGLKFNPVSPPDQSIEMTMPMPINNNDSDSDSNNPNKHPISRYVKHNDKLLHLTSFLLKHIYLTENYDDIVISGKGKPYLSPFTHTHVTGSANTNGLVGCGSFSVTHHGDLCVLGVLECSSCVSVSVGIDVTDMLMGYTPLNASSSCLPSSSSSSSSDSRCEDVKSYLKNFHNSLTDAEVDYIHSFSSSSSSSSTLELDNDEGRRGWKIMLCAFSIIWAIKESYIKALGVGMYLDLACVEVSGLEESVCLYLCDDDDDDDERTVKIEHFPTKQQQQQQAKINPKIKITVNNVDKSNLVDFKVDIVNRDMILAICYVSTDDGDFDVEYKSCNFTSLKSGAVDGDDEGCVPKIIPNFVLVHLKLMDLVDLFVGNEDDDENEGENENEGDVNLAASNADSNTVTNNDTDTINITNINSASNTQGQRQLIPFSYNPPNYISLLSSPTYTLTLPYPPNDTKLTPSQKRLLHSITHSDTRETFDLKISQHHAQDGSGGTSPELGFGGSVYPCAVLMSLIINNNVPLGCFDELIGIGRGIGYDDDDDDDDDDSSTADNKIQSILELGCGTGIVSITAACTSNTISKSKSKASALNDLKYVLCTDGDEISVNLASFNITANSNSWNSSNSSNSLHTSRNAGCKIKIESCKLLWNDSIDTLVIQNKLLSNTNKSTPDVLLITDCIALPYALSFPSLISAISTFTSASTILIIVYHPRSKEVEDGFFSMLEEVCVVRILNGGERERVCHEDFIDGFQREGGGRIEVIVCRRKHMGRK